MNEDLTALKIDSSRRHWLTAALVGTRVWLLFKEKKPEEKEEQLLVTESSDGVAIDGETRQIKLVFASGLTEKLEACRDFRLCVSGGKYYLTYVFDDGAKKWLTLAISQDGRTFTVSGAVRGVAEAGWLLPDFSLEDNLIFYFGQKNIGAAMTKNFLVWSVGQSPILTGRPGMFDSQDLLVLGGTVREGGPVVIYDCTTSGAEGQTVMAGAARIDPKEPTKVTWRGEVPLFEQEIKGENLGLTAIAAVFWQGRIYFYYAAQAGGLFIGIIPDPFTSAGPNIILQRHAGNPIIAPDPTHSWESDGTFNPAAWYDGEKVHIVYRAVGGSGVSVMGYATSANGVDIDERSETPIYVPRAAFEGGSGKPAKINESFVSGWGWGGCEDPKLTEIEGKIYMTYVAHNGWGPPRAALSSMDKDDFLAQKWDKWSAPQLISRPGEVNKSACLLPEKIGGKFVIFHRVFPNILIDVVDDLEFGEGHKWLSGHYKIPPRQCHWDCRKVSVGATPLKTPLGWLVIYHGLGGRDPYSAPYMVGAMMLDLKDPTKVLFRTNRPILKPETWYENEGKPDVVYPSGAAIVGEKLHVYYGGGDRVVCVATASLPAFLEAMQEEREFEPILKPAK